MKYEMLSDARLEPKAKKGTFVYQCKKHDFGLASDDSRILGYPCQSVTLNEDGDYPSFVVPSSQLKRVDDKN